MFNNNNNNNRRDHLPPVVYYLHSTKLPTVDDFTDVGVTYDHHFSFSAHFDRIVTKASERARLILMCFSTRDPAVLMMAFNIYVRPILEYTTVVWSPFSIANSRLCKKGSVRDCMVCRI